MLIEINPLSLTQRNSRELDAFFRVHKVFRFPQIFVSNKNYQLGSDNVYFTQSLFVSFDRQKKTLMVKVVADGDMIDCGGFGDIYDVLGHLTKTGRRTWRFHAQPAEEAQIAKCIYYESYAETLPITKQDVIKAKKKINAEHEKMKKFAPNLYSKKALFFSNIGVLFMRKIPVYNLCDYSAKIKDGLIKPDFFMLITIFRNAAIALNYLHQHDVIHRDIKPQNLMLDLRTLAITIIDFGFARHQHDALHKKICNKGSHPFMPPEIMVMKHDDNPTLSALYITQKGDIYSLGISFAILAGDRYLHDLFFYYDSALSRFTAEHINKIWERAVKERFSGLLESFPDLDPSIARRVINLIQNMTRFTMNARIPLTDIIDELGSIRQTYQLTHAYSHDSGSIPIVASSSSSTYAATSFSRFFPLTLRPPSGTNQLDTTCLRTLSV